MILDIRGLVRQQPVAVFPEWLVGHAENVERILRKPSSDFHVFFESLLGDYPCNFNDLILLRQRPVIKGAGRNDDTGRITHIIKILANVSAESQKMRRGLRLLQHGPILSPRDIM